MKKKTALAIWICVAVVVVAIAVLLLLPKKADVPEVSAAPENTPVSITAEEEVQEESVQIVPVEEETQTEPEPEADLEAEPELLPEESPELPIEEEDTAEELTPEEILQAALGEEYDADVGMAAPTMTEILAYVKDIHGQGAQTEYSFVYVNYDVYQHSWTEVDPQIQSITPGKDLIAYIPRSVDDLSMSAMHEANAEELSAFVEDFFAAYGKEKELFFRFVFQEDSLACVEYFIPIL